MGLTREEIEARLRGDAKPATTAQPTAPVREKRDTGEMIVKQTCIKAAAEFHANRPASTVAEMLRTAEILEEWIWR